MLLERARENAGQIVLNETKFHLEVFLQQCSFNTIFIEPLDQNHSRLNPKTP